MSGHLVLAQTPVNNMHDPLGTFGYVQIVSDHHDYISFLRQKFASLNTPVQIKTVRGIGYRLEVSK